MSNLGELPCSNVVASLQLDWPGLQISDGLAWRSRLGRFTEVAVRKLTPGSGQGNYSLSGSLAPGQVAALSFSGRISAASKGRTVTMNSWATSNQAATPLETSSFSVPQTCGCGLVYDYTFKAPPCIGQLFSCAASTPTIPSALHMIGVHRIHRRD